MDTPNTPTPTPSSVLSEITAAELTLLKGPLLAFAQQLQTPGVNILSLQNDIANIGLQLPQLSGPAQSVALNVIGTALGAWISTLGVPQAAPANTASEKVEEAPKEEEKKEAVEEEKQA